MKPIPSCLCLAAMLSLLSCGKSTPSSETPAEAHAEASPEHTETMKTFTSDLSFLMQHTKAIVLGSGDGKVIVVPEYQGRVMTSTTGDEADLSFGWLNYKLIESGIQSREQAKGTLQEHIHVFGGEERFWLGPEGGQFSIFFKAGSAFDFDHWFTPPLIDTESFDLVSSTADEALFTKNFEIDNFSGTRFKGDIQRRVKVLDPKAIAAGLDIQSLPDGVRSVAYVTENTLTNRGEAAWTRESGMLSIWMLGMYQPGEETTVVIPFKDGPEEELGPKVNDSYFGKVPADRLVVKDEVLFFSGDGKHRSKIGVSPQRSKGIAGSYDAIRGVLTLVTYNERDASLPYVNSMWEHQQDPFSGDVVNSYNDGPPEPGAAPLGPFYELETSSPAAELAPGESLTHVQRTCHLQGSEEALDPIARQLLGVSLQEIKDALE